MTASPAPSVDPLALAKLDASVQADIDAGRHFGASLLVARAGEVVHRASLGTVTPEGRRGTDTDKYLLMSMSKSYTAVLVLRAIQAGRFDLGTPVAELIPAFGAHGKTTATVSQLLCHTAGLPAAPVPAPLPLSAMGDLGRTSAAICKLKPVYEPGTHCVYTSGTGYDMLGRILVETDPGHRPFRQIAREELFEPWGLQQTSFGLRVDEPTRVPVSFTPKATTPVSPIMARTFNEVIDERSDYPCAGAFSTIDDVFAFTEALQGRSPAGPLLTPDLFAQARQNHTGNMPLEVMTTTGLPAIRQALRTFGLMTMISQARSGRAAAIDAKAPEVYPANFTLLGGYTRGIGDYLTPAGRTATTTALAAVGGGSTGWMIDTERDLTFVFLSAGLVEGFDHPKRLQRLADLAIATIRD